MKRVLVLFAHPMPRRSRVNSALNAAVREMEGVTFHDLYETYPDFHIDVRREQELLVKHDVIVLQHPFYWYSTPPLLKQWQDLVLEHGFAYGNEGNALEGKGWLQAITTGGSEGAYQSSGMNRFTIRHLLAPLEATAYLCRMIFLPPFVISGTFQIADEALARHVLDYGEVLRALRDERISLEPSLPHAVIQEMLSARS